jgi:hypothetical protein
LARLGARGGAKAEEEIGSKVVVLGIICGNITQRIYVLWRQREDVIGLADWVILKENDILARCFYS